ncbi:MAG: (d)CMP kinase [Rhodospirillales bacterium]|nr:(d)CMP kinase [Rhodospirillales bacterium]
MHTSPHPAPKVIAIDGPAGAGKGTLARRLADHFGFAHLDTGLLYRAVGVKLLQAGEEPTDVKAASIASRSLTAAELSGEALRTDAAAVAASKVAAIPAVREALLTFQRDFASRPPGDAVGAVLDGRDIGTVVCPDAPIKLFVTAEIEIRAKRRVKELRERGLKAIEKQVLSDMQSRDKRDSQRLSAPMEPASDAFVIDTGGLDPESVFALAIAYIAGTGRFEG